MLKPAEYIVAAFFLVLALVLAPVQKSRAEVSAHAGLKISGAWVRMPPPGAPTAAGYMVITNHGSKADRLVSASVPFAGVTEIHTMSMKDGVMKMRMLPNGVVIEPGKSVMLKPGGQHLMFLKLKAPLEPGGKVSGTLTFENAGAVAVEFDVRAKGGGHGHSGMKKEMPLGMHK